MLELRSEHDRGERHLWGYLVDVLELREMGVRVFNGALLDVRSAAAFLGVTEKTLRARVARQTVPFRRLGGRVIFLKSELEAFLESLPGCDLTEALENVASRRVGHDETTSAAFMGRRLAGAERMGSD